jgi:hypothetical protein
MRDDPTAVLSCGAEPAGQHGTRLVPCSGSPVQRGPGSARPGCWRGRPETRRRPGAEPVAGRVSGRQRLQFFL